MNSAITNLRKKLVQVAVDAPLEGLFDYFWEFEQEPELGQIVHIEFGKKQTVGVVVSTPQQPVIDIEKIKSIVSIAPLPALPRDLIALAKFSSSYYGRPMGEMLTHSIPKAWRNPSRWALLTKNKKEKEKKNNDVVLPPRLNEQQNAAVKALIQSSQSGKYQTYLLQGVTGSGKTVTYLSWLKELLIEPKSQVLMMVPEINLTPQLESIVRAGLPGLHVVTLHSGLSDRVRADHWSKILRGEARVILGTRMAVMCPAPTLTAIVVDEEHDLSYKQQEGARYSARDLAVWRSKQLGITNLLVSATPSIETWTQAKKGKYKKLEITERAQTTQLPSINLIDLKQQQQTGQNIESGLSQPLLEAIQKNLDKNKQALIFLNRRGYAPVLSCQACGWLSNCQKCSTYMVLHRIGSPQLCCHHCGLINRVPRQCPSCGNHDLAPLGKGTQKIEELLREKFPTAKILRVDADSTRLKGAAEELFEQIHEGQADIIVGTQMITKGHDYQRVGLVGVVDADASLYSHDFRAAERLFAQLMQVTGRAGRAQNEEAAVVMIQTNHPEALPYEYLKKNDTNGFLEKILNERQVLGLPPYSYQSLVHVEHRDAEQATKMLSFAVKAATAQADWPQSVSVSDIVPRAVQKIAGKERYQVLLECISRNDLQAATEIIQAQLNFQNKKIKGVGWYVERDPVQI